jgi:hypothetical protein
LTKNPRGILFIATLSASTLSYKFSASTYHINTHSLGVKKPSYNTLHNPKVYCLFSENLFANYSSPLSSPQLAIFDRRSVGIQTLYFATDPSCQTLPHSILVKNTLLVAKTKGLWSVTAKTSIFLKFFANNFN